MSVRAAAPLNGTVPAGTTPPSSSPPVKRGGLSHHTLPVNMSQNKTSTTPHLLNLRGKFWSPSCRDGRILVTNDASMLTIS